LYSCVHSSPFFFRPKGLMVWVCLSVCLDGWMYVRHASLLQHLRNHMSRGNKGNQPERKLAAIAKRARALRTSAYRYIQSTLKRNLHRELYTY
jgi:polyphosphate kinase